MRTLIAAMITLGLAAAPALAGDAPKTKADCEKAGMKWDEASQTCAQRLLVLANDLLRGAPAIGRGSSFSWHGFELRANGSALPVQRADAA